MANPPSKAKRSSSGESSAPDGRRAAAERICGRLIRAGHRALLAGGCVRDLLLGRTPKDYDIATSARPEEVMQLFEHTIDVGAAYGVLLVVVPEGPFEVATFRIDGPYLDGRRPSRVEFTDEKADAQRRDFTINALFYDLQEDRVIDYVGGQEDLGAKVVRAVGDPRVRFQEDHLRLLRAVRFAARLGYCIEEATAAAVREMANLIRKTSAERVRDELFKILTEGGARRAFELMDDLGLLEAVLPEVARMKGVSQPAEFHPEGDVFTHTLLMLEMLDNPSSTLAMGVLLHDVGKPLTQTVQDRIRFHNHTKVGAELARDICKRLRVSNDDTGRIVWLVAQHMRLADAPEMRESRLKRFVRHEGFSELVELCRLDALASHRSLDTIEWIERYLAQLKPEEVRPKAILTGDDLIAMGYRPGPLFGEILRSIEDAQLEGSLTTPEEARQFVRSRWPS